MPAKRQTGYQVQAEVFKAELTRRLVNDCVNAFGRLYSVRTDIRHLTVRPIEDPDETEAWAEIVVILQSPDSQAYARSFAYVRPGEPAARIDELIQESVESCERDLSPAGLAERKRLARLDELKVALSEADPKLYPERYKSLQLEYRRLLARRPT